MDYLTKNHTLSKEVLISSNDRRWFLRVYLFLLIGLSSFVGWFIFLLLSGDKHVIHIDSNEHRLGVSVILFCVLALFFWFGFQAASRIPKSVHLMRPNGPLKEQLFRLRFNCFLPIFGREKELIIKRSDILLSLWNGNLLSSNYHVFLTTRQKRMLIYAENKREAMELVNLFKAGFD